MSDNIMWRGRMDGRTMEVRVHPEWTNEVRVTDTRSKEFRDFDMDSVDFGENIVLWVMHGVLIQHCFPDFTTDEREFIMSGSAWDEVFGSSTDEEGE